jgi:hypothetical protein
MASAASNKKQQKVVSRSHLAVTKNGSWKMAVGLDQQRAVSDEKSAATGMFPVLAGQFLATCSVWRMKVRGGSMGQVGRAMRRMRGACANYWVVACLHTTSLREHSTKQAFPSADTLSAAVTSE